jgi:glutamyl-tRNA(Gln) amidotransferase subunit E
MSIKLDPYSIKLKVGFEIHQQLSSKNKLFCTCPNPGNASSDSYEYEFMRRLRPTFSELGEYDKAALFEFSKGKVIRYVGSKDTSCLVEMDEEPPHDVNKEALETALIIALALKASIVDEVHVMRKIVIDGSNTTGFQRTMLIATNGVLKVKDREVKVQSICLEEDAARLVKDENGIRTYALDRLGVPLVEIALEPVTASIDELAEIALSLGRLLRASRRVARGLGTIRQDVNISILDSKSVVEVKGVQRIDQLKKVIEYEMYRQHALNIIAEMLKAKNIQFNAIVYDVSSILSNTRSKIIRRALEQEQGIVKAIVVKGFAGMLSYEPYEGIRLGKELGEMVRFYGLGGIFHSDELPAYGITFEDINSLKCSLGLDDNDAFILIAGLSDQVNNAVDAIVERLKHAFIGVPAETRAATDDGRTIYSRPRPGAARMYPETDVPPIPISKDILDSLISKVPKPWDEYIDDLSKRYNINRVLAEKAFDSDYFELFEDLASNITNVQASFIASVLTEGIVSLERQGLDTSKLKHEHIRDAFARLAKGDIAKESILNIFSVIMEGKAGDVDQAISILGLKAISDEELIDIIDGILSEHSNLIKDKGMGALNALMGIAMGKLRGRVDGKKVNSVLKRRLMETIGHR